MSSELGSRIARAVRLQQAGDYEGALREFDALLRSVPSLSREETAEVLGWKAMCLEEAGRFAEAVSDLRLRLRTIDEQDSWGQYSTMLALAETHNAAGRSDMAALWLRKALKLSASAAYPFGESAVAFAARSGLPELSYEDDVLLRRILVRRWKSVGLSGEPDLSDRERAAMAIAEAENRLWSKGTHLDDSE